MIKIVNRRKYMVKLANGEFVAPSELEGVFAQSPLISQVYVHGDLLKDYLVLFPNYFYFYGYLTL